MPQSAQVKIKELDVKLKLLEQKNKRLEKQLKDSTEKSNIFDMMIDCYGKNIEDIKVLVADAIHKYNSLRPHYSCYYLTPEQMDK